MCSEYTVKTDKEKIQEILDRAVKVVSANKSWDKKIKFTNLAPTLSLGKNGLELSERVFPVNPFPNARLSGVEGKDEDTDEETQIRRIYDVPLWKQAFEENPLLVPMTGFLEPVYWGDEAGKVMEFKISKTPLFFAAGIQIQPRVPKTGGNNGFALITHSATSQMLKYHQRLVAVFKPEDALGYLEAANGRERFEYTLEKRYHGELIVQEERVMAKGWEKRVDIQKGKLAREKKYVQALKSEGIDG